MFSLKTITRLLPPDLRKRGRWVIASTGVISILDLAGIATLFPLILILLDPTSEIMIHWKKIAGNYGIPVEGQTFTTVLIVGLLVFLILKNLITQRLHAFRVEYLCEIYRKTTLSLFDHYYEQGLLFVKQNKITELILNINRSAHILAWSVMMPLFVLFTEGGLLLGMILVLFALYPLPALLVIACLFPILGLLMRFQLQKVKRLGEEEHKTNNERYRITSQTFRGYSEVEVYDAFGRLRNSFRLEVDRGMAVRAHMERAFRIPPMILEIITVAGIGILLLLSGKSSLVTVALFGTITLRMLPSLRQVMANWSQLKNQQHVLERIEEAYDLPKNRVTREMIVVFDNRIDVCHLNFGYDDKSLIRDLSFTVKRGERINLCGASGRGKSTLFKLLLGLFIPTGGEIKIDGVPLCADNVHSWRKQIGYVPQEVFLFDGSLAENIALGDQNPDYNRIEELVNRVALRQRVNALGDGIYSAIGDNGSLLSGGERQRVGIARALYRQPRLLLLDEATCSVDAATEQEIFATLMEIAHEDKELTIIAASHHALPWSATQSIEL